MDEQFLYAFGLVKVNSLRLMHDRGFPVDERRFWTPYQMMEDLYARAMASGKSLAEEATESFGPVTTVFIDRNYDYQKRKEKMISTDQIKELASNILLIVPYKLSPQAKKEIQKNKEIELFTFDDLVFDIPRHVLYMKHEVVPVHVFEAETGYRQKPNDLPKMLRTDAVARWFGFREGSIVKIHRPEGYVFRTIQSLHE
jgi:DNA-directed RNA polymerase I, II, and III subunit RPABC1